jgi:hypothetical protein
MASLNQQAASDLESALDISFESATDSNTTQESPNKKSNKRVRTEDDPNVSTVKTKKKRITNEDLFNQNQALLNKLCSMDRQVKLVENNLLMLQSSTNSIDEKIEKMKSDMERKISSHDSDISQLQYEVKALNDTVHKIISDKDNVYFELNKLNLILSGIPDSSSETPDQLVQKMKPLLSRITSTHINIDCAYRLGKFSPKYPRRIKIRLLSLSERNLIWSHREKAPPLFYVNEDLSPNVRQVQGQLRQQKREILEKNPSAKLWIDWKKLTLNSGERPMSSASVYRSGAPRNSMETDASTSRSSTSNFLGTT